MKKCILICFAIFISLLTHAQATDLVVDCQTPGWLSSMINYGDQKTLEALKVKGYINADDLKFIGNLINNYSLKGCIDISEVEIVASNNNKANTLKENCFGINGYVEVRVVKFPNSITSAENILGDGLYIDSLCWNVNNVNGNVFHGIAGGNKTICNNLILGENVTIIDELAFENQFKLKNVYFPKSLTYIGERAFDGTEMKYANIEDCDKLVYIGEYAFGNKRSPEVAPFAMDTLIIPKSLVEFNTTAFNYKNHEHIFISAGTTILSSGYLGTGTWDKWTHNEYMPDTLFFHMESKTPPTRSFTMKSNYVVYVPKGAKMEYMNNNAWKNAKIIEVDVEDATAICDFKYKESEVGEVRDLIGNKVKTMKNGQLYIRNGRKFIGR